MKRIPNLCSRSVFRLIFIFIFLLSPLILLAQSKSLSTKTDAFLKSLSEDQKGALMFPFDEINRYDWHFVPPNQFQRTGIPIKSLDTLQKDAFSAMLQQFLSEKGYVKTKKIMDLDIILLSSIIATLFIVFMIAVYREFSVMEEEPYTFQKESGPRAGLVNFVGNLAVNKSLTVDEKKVIYQAMHRNIADMESDGVYFDESLKVIVAEQMDDLGVELVTKPVRKKKSDN